MSVQNILDPATGKIQSAFVDVGALGVVTNPLTSNIDGVTAYGLVDANVVSTGALQTDSISAYATLPGAPVAVISDLKLQTPAKQIGFEDITGPNTLYSLAQLNLNAGGKIVLNAATSVEIPKVGGPTELVMTGNGGSLFVRNDAGYGEVVCNEPLRLIGEAINTTSAAVYIDTSALKVLAGNDTPTIFANSLLNTATVMAKSGNVESKLTAGATEPKVILQGPTAATPVELIYDEAAAKLYTAGGSAGNQLTDVELLTTNFRVSTGITEGVEIVSGGTESVVRGKGLPLIIAKAAGFETSHSITLDNSSSISLISDPASGGSISLGGLTQYNISYRNLIGGDLNNIEQIASNNAYVPMTWYQNNISFTIDATPTLAFDGPDFIWRYSGIFGPSGLTSESAFCSSRLVQVDVNVAAEDFNDDVVWWVVLLNSTNGIDYNARDFINERFGFINLKQTNPSNGIRNQTFSFSTVFDLTSAGSPPDDGDKCRFRVFGYGTTTTSTPRAQVSLTVRPLRNMV